MEGPNPTGSAVYRGGGRSATPGGGFSAWGGGFLGGGTERLLLFRRPRRDWLRE